MSDDELNLLCRDLALLKTLKIMTDRYSGMKLSDGQIYRLYQENFDPQSFKEIVKNGLSEDLP